MHADPGASSVPIQRVDDRLHEARGGALAAWRTAREAGAVDRARARVADAARGDANLMPPVLDAVKSGATLGEISDTLRGVWGEHRPA